MRTPSTLGDQPAGADAVFGQILVGVDERPESLVAAAQAAVVRAPGGSLVLVGVAERYLAAHAGLAAADAEEQVLAATRHDLERASELVAADETALVTGRLVPVLRRECERRGATLIAVGAQPHRRLPALALGGYDVAAVHDAPCSVLVARPGWGPHRPERIVLGLDGSPASRTAEAAARSLAERLGCELVTVVGLADAEDLAALRAGREDAVLDPGSLADAVSGCATRASLVVVGRDDADRRRRAATERIASAARCSVLLVRHRPGEDAGR